MPKETKEEKLNKFKDDFIKALEDFALSKYKKALSDTLIERNILDKKGNVIQIDQMLIGNKVSISDEKFKESGEFIAIINKQPKTFKFDQESQKIVEVGKTLNTDAEQAEEKKKNADNMQDRNRLRWYKVLVALIYALLKLLKLLFVAGPKKIAGAVRAKNMEKSHVNAMKTYNNTPIAQRSVSRASAIDFGFEIIDSKDIEKEENKEAETIVIDEEENINDNETVRLSEISDAELNTNLNINREQYRRENNGMSERDDIEIEINRAKLEDDAINNKNTSDNISRESSNDNIINDKDNEEFIIQSNDGKIEKDVDEIKNRESELIDLNNVDLRLSKEDEKVINKENTEDSISKENLDIKK